MTGRKAPTNPPQRDPSPSRASSSSEERYEWVKLAYDAGIDGLKAQREELGSIRTRALAFSSLTITATAFLVGTGLKDAARSPEFYAWAIAGSVGFVAVAVCLILTLLPAIKFRFILESEQIIAWIEGDKPAASRTVALRYAAKDEIPDMRRTNERSLKHVRRFYRGTLFSAAITLAIWVTVVWMFT